MNHRNLSNLSDLANYLSIHKSLLEIVCSTNYNTIHEIEELPSNEIEQINFIKEIRIQKKDKTLRTVYSPISETLINILKVLKEKLDGICEVHPNVHSYIKGRSINSNATVHLAKKIIFQADILNFFDSISKNSVEESLTILGFHPAVSKLISEIVTHNDSLVQGFHTSPIISNIIFSEIDTTFSKLNPKICYSRYADDLYFSSNETINIHEEIKRILSEKNLYLNENKTKYFYRGRKQYVTGLTVFDSSHPRIARRIKKDLRQKLHYIKLYGYLGHQLHILGITYEDYLHDAIKEQEVQQEITVLKINIAGWLNFMKPIEPKFFEKYFNIFIAL